MTSILPLKEAFVKELANGETFTLPQKWKYFTMFCDGGTGTITDTKANVVTVIDQQGFDYGDVDNAAGIDSQWVIAAVGGVVRIAYNI